MATKAAGNEAASVAFKRSLKDFADADAFNEFMEREDVQAIFDKHGLDPFSHDEVETNVDELNDNICADLQAIAGDTFNQ